MDINSGGTSWLGPQPMTAHALLLHCTVMCADTEVFMECAVECANFAEKRLQIN